MENHELCWACRRKWNVFVYFVTIKVLGLLKVSTAGTKSLKTTYIDDLKEQQSFWR